MNQVFKYIKDFYTREFNFLYLLLIIAMLAILIYFNYWHGLERKYVAGGKTKLARFAGYYLLYFVPFATAFLLQLLFFKDCSYYKNGWFWAILLLAPAIFSLRVNIDFHSIWFRQNNTGIDQIFYRHSINWVARSLLVLILIFIVWFIKDKQHQPFYGTAALGHAKPYLIMLLIMIPFIALASTQKDFLQVYPKAKLIGEIPVNGWANKGRYLLFELFYGFDFVSIEFFFRGFLILSLTRICGTHCIIPAACFYCSIHFGKPMGEAVSSFFGGLLLGIISYNTRSIWGGLLLHLGIAWLMEAGGFIGNWSRKLPLI